MPAKIVLQSPDAEAVEHWIDRPVLRIGSSLNCDVHLSSNESVEHALTLEYRAGSYYLHNRSAERLRIGTKALEPGTKDTWPKGASVTMSNGAVLKLLIDGNPAPSPAPENFDAVESAPADDLDVQDDSDDPTDGPVIDAAGATAALGSAAHSKTTVQLAVTMLCIVGIVVILWSKAASETPPATKQQASLQQVVQKLLSSTDANVQRFAHRLQEAEGNWQRGQSETAMLQFSALRHDVRSTTAQEQEDLKDLIGLLESRLGATDQ